MIGWRNSRWDGSIAGDVCPTAASSGPRPARLQLRRQRRCIRRDFLARACWVIPRKTAAGKTPVRSSRSGRAQTRRTRRGKARAPKSRADRVGGAVTKRRREQVVQMTAFFRDDRLARFDQLLQPVLLGKTVAEFRGRNAMLGFDRSPCPGGERLGVTIALRASR